MSGVEVRVTQGQGMDIASDLNVVVAREGAGATGFSPSPSQRHSRRGTWQADRQLSRLFDIAGACLLLLFVAPLLAVIAIAIAFQRSGPIFFRQTRIGLGSDTFQVLKFRTMVPDAEARLIQYLAENPEAAAEWRADHKLRHDPRTTPFGRFLRRSSLDELPQLFNVLRGDMSLVGPRPIVAAEVAKYGRHFPAYISVKPGLTGRWQVSGRNDVSYPRRVRMDAAYARSRCLALDVRILVETVPAVLKRRGSY